MLIITDKTLRTEVFLRFQTKSRVSLVTLFSPLAYNYIVILPFLPAHAFPVFNPRRNPSVARLGHP